MPPVRHNPSQRVHDRAKFPDTTLRYAEASSSAPFSTAPPNTSQNQHSSLVCNGRPVTPAAHYLLVNGVDPPLLHDFSPVFVHDPSHIFDPTSSLPLPPKPGASLPQNDTSSLLERAPSPSSIPSDSYSSSPSTTPLITHRSPKSKPSVCPSITPVNLLPTAYARQSAQPARPPNHFLLFRADYFARIKSLRLSKSRYTSLPKDYHQWDRAPDTVKTYYRELAHLTKVVHGRLYPGYKYKPRTKDERQRQKDEKARLKQEAKIAAQAIRKIKSQAKTSTRTAAKTSVHIHPSPPPPTSVDVRIYDPSRRTYHRSPPFQVHAVSPPSPRLPPPSSLPSTPLPAPSAVRNVMHHQDTERHAPNFSPHMTSPATTLFQADETESPRFVESSGCMEDGDMLEDIWPTIEEGVVDWYQAAPPHWCGPDNHASFCDDDACDNCVAMSWSDELNIDIPTASTTALDEGNFTTPNLSFTPLAPALPLHTHCRPTLSLPTIQFASDIMEALLASTMESGMGETDAFWSGLFVEPLYGSSSTSSVDSTLANTYTTLRSPPSASIRSPGNGC